MTYQNIHFRRPETEDKQLIPAWREDFEDPVRSGRHFIPKDWKFKGKPGTSSSVFEVRSDDPESSVLYVISDNSSGTLITLAGVNLQETPVIRWRWRVDSLPVNADGRSPDKDDQAIGIYVGSGSMFNNRSISYRWDTNTPVNSSGTSVYGLGTVNVRWYTIRNEEDMKNNGWYIESRNILEDFRSAWGEIPEKVYVSISGNSQYTSSEALGMIDWIEFVGK